MTIQEILTQVKAGKLDMAKAQEMIAAQQTGGAFAANSVSILKNSGRIRVNSNGAQIDMSALQAIAVLSMAEKIREAIKPRINADHRVETAVNKRGDKEEPYEKHFLGDLFVGYRAEQVAALKASFSK